MIYKKLKFDDSFKTKILKEFKEKLLHEHQNGKVFFSLLEDGLSRFFNFQAADDNIPSNEQRRETLRSVQKTSEILQTKIEALHHYDKSILNLENFFENPVLDEKYPSSLVDQLAQLSELCASTLRETKPKPGRSQGQLLQLPIAIEKAMIKCIKPSYSKRSYDESSTFVCLLDEVLEYASTRQEFGLRGKIYEKTFVSGTRNLARSIAKSYCQKGH